MTQNITEITLAKGIKSLLFNAFNKTKIFFKK